MVGHILPVDERARRPWLERAEVLGQPILRALVPLPPGTGERTVRRRVNQAAWLLRDSGVCRTLVPPEFPWWLILKEEGLSPVDPEPLLQAVAAPLVLAELVRRRADPWSAVVALRGARVSRAMQQAAQRLCPAVRALAISAADAPSLREYLRREYGVPVLEDAPGLAPDAAVHFSPGLPWPGALELCAPTPELHGLTLALAGETLPTGFDLLPLFTLLWETGRLKNEDITIN